MDQKKQIWVEKPRNGSPALGHPEGWKFEPVRCVLYNSSWRHIFTEPEPNMIKFTLINDIITHTVIA